MTWEILYYVYEQKIQSVNQSFRYNIVFLIAFRPAPICGDNPDPWLYRQRTRIHKWAGRKYAKINDVNTACDFMLTSTLSSYQR